MKVLHLEHPEDLILEGDLKVFDALYGTNPENGKFFVGTKSVFNKVKNMVCYTVEDIFNKYNEETHKSVIEILTMCLYTYLRLMVLYKQIS